MVLEGFTDSGLGVALDVLRAGNALSLRAGKRAPFEVEVLTPRADRRVRAASGLETRVHGTVARLTRCDVVLVPGCWLEGGEGVAALLARAEAVKVIAELERAAERGALIGASCAGTFLLAATGRLDGGVATTTWWLAEAFRARFPGVKLDVERTLTAQGRLLCAGTVFAMADLALSIVSRIAGPALARQCMRVLLLDRHASQAPYMVLRDMVHDEPVVQAAERWVRKHLAETVRVEHLARAVGASPRTLARRLDETLGTTPLGFIQRMRLEAATHLLESSKASLEEIAARVGYRDAGTLRRLMRRKLGSRPSELRHQA